MRKLTFLHLAGIALLIALFCAPATPAYAQQPPAYLHALSDLRMARAWIVSDSRPQFNNEKRHAVEEIDHAIREIKRAAADDGKNVNFLPPPQGPQSAAAPMHSALSLLDEAYNDCAKGQDSPQSVGLQVRALQHIGEARGAVTHIIQLVGQGR